MYGVAVCLFLRPVEREIYMDAREQREEINRIRDCIIKAFDDLGELSPIETSLALILMAIEAHQRGCPDMTDEEIGKALKSMVDWLQKHAQIVPRHGVH